MNETLAPWALSASATARAGTTWPAVPPAPITIRGSRTPHAFYGPQAPRSRLGDVEQEPYRGEHHTQVGGCVGDEWQWDAGERGEPQHDEDVEDALAQNQRGQPGGEQLGIPPSGPAR